MGILRYTYEIIQAKAIVCKKRTSHIIYLYQGKCFLPYSSLIIMNHRSTFFFLLQNLLFLLYFCDTLVVHHILFRLFYCSLFRRTAIFLQLPTTDAKQKQLYCYSSFCFYPISSFFVAHIII